MALRSLDSNVQLDADIRPKSGQTPGVPQGTPRQLSRRKGGMHQLLTPKRGSEILPRTRDNQRQIGRQMPKLPSPILRPVGSRKQHGRPGSVQACLDLIEAHDNMSSAPRKTQPVKKPSGEQGFDAVGQTIQNHDGLPGCAAEQSFVDCLVYHISRSTQPHTAPGQPLIDIRMHLAGRIDDETDHAGAIQLRPGHQATPDRRRTGGSVITVGHDRPSGADDVVGQQRRVRRKRRQSASLSFIRKPAWPIQSSRMIRPLKLR